MSFEKLAEKKIQEAMAEGEFDNLPGRGQPIDLRPYFAMPEDLRVGYSVLKSAGFLPEEMQLLKDVEALRVALERETDEAARQRLRQQIDDNMLKFRLMMERNRTRRARSR